MPVNPSPAVGRVAAILRTIAGSPTGSLSLAELARATGISKPTAHSLLLGLTEEALLLRSPESPPRYRLGPALASLGAAAQSSRPLTAVAEPEVDGLMHGTGYNSMLGTIEGDEIVVLLARSPGHPFGMEITEGHRTALRPPVGSVYLAWSGREAISAWLDSGRPMLGRAAKAAWRRRLADVRSRGWSLTMRDPTAPNGEPVHEAEQSDLADGPLNIIGISAPVRGVDGGVVAALAVVGPPEPLSARQIETVATIVVEAAERVTQGTRGSSHSLQIGNTRTMMQVLPEESV